MTKALKTVLSVVAWIVAAALFLFIVLQILGLHRSDPSQIKKYETTNPLITERTQISCHRGGAELLPEESMMAFRRCIEDTSFEADCFEFDLHATKDGELILLHDDTLDRTTDAEEVFGERGVKPEDKTLAELKTLNIGAKFVDADGNMPFADLHGDDVPDDLRVVTLEEVLTYLSSKGDFNYIIEIKNGGDLGRRAVDKMHDVLSDMNLFHKVAFGTFHEEISSYVDENYPDILRSTSINEVISFWIAALTNKKDYVPPCCVLQIPFCDPYLKFGVNLGTAQCINYAHAHDMAVQYWTVNNEADMRYLVSVGADCIMTDSPDVLWRVMNEEK